MKNQILAQTADVPVRAWEIRDNVLVFREGERNRTLLTDTVDSAAACLDTDLSPCALAVSGGRLIFVPSRGEIHPVTSPCPPGSRWISPVVGAGTELYAAAVLRDANGDSVLRFHRMPDGSFRGRRLFGGSRKPELLEMTADPPGMRLFFCERREGMVTVLSGDPTADPWRERVEFSVPNPAEGFCFFRRGTDWHFACLSRGALFADGMPLEQGDVRDVCLYPEGDALCCACRRDGLRRTYVLGDAGWELRDSVPTDETGTVRLLLAGQSCRVFAREEYAEPEKNRAEERMPETYRQILSNQALVIRTMREKQEIMQRALFSLQARCEAYVPRMDELRRRCDALETALRAVEAVYRGTRT